MKNDWTLNLTLGEVKINSKFFGREMTDEEKEEYEKCLLSKKLHKEYIESLKQQGIETREVTFELLEK
jgi:hypothetical protein